MRKTFQSALLAVGITIAGLAAAPPANADTPCPSGYFCIYEHTNFEGRMGKFSGSNGFWQGWSTPGSCATGNYTWTNCMSSYRNNTNQGFRLYEQKYCQGPSLWAGTYTAARSLPAGWNDVVSSDMRVDGSNRC